MQRAQEPTTPDGMQRFANGLRQDRKEVSAAVERHWSNGRAEKDVNRIKMIKRKMYGRAKFDCYESACWPAAGDRRNPASCN